MTFGGRSTGSHASAEYEITRLRQENGAFRDQLMRIGSQPAPVAIVLEVKSKRTTLLRDGQRYEVMTPAFKVEPTNFVHVHPESHGIIDLLEDPDISGIVAKVARVVDDRHLEIDHGAGGGPPRIVIFHGKEPKQGDRVIVDGTGSIVLRNLGPASGLKAAVETGVDWDDIGGQVEAKRLLRSAVEGPVVDKELRARYGKKRTKGALLAGPAGTGKTLLGKACATALARLHGKETTASGFQYVNGPELLAPLLGNSEAGVRALFENARAHFREHGYPGVIFLDEGDARLSRRDSARLNNTEKTIVPMFLTEMDGIDDSCAFVLVATNRPDMLDPAVTREGRLDLKIQVGRPSREDAAAILERYFAARPLDGMTAAQAAEKGVEHVFAPRHTLYMVRMKAGGDRRFTLGELVSGALLAGLVERATDHAIDRDRAAGEVTGIRTADILAAADALCTEQKLLEHRTDLDEFVADFGADVRAIERAK